MTRTFQIIENHKRKEVVKCTPEEIKKKLQQMREENKNNKYYRVYAYYVD